VFSISEQNEVDNLYKYIIARTETFTAAKVDKIFSGYQLCQVVQNYQLIRRIDEKILSNLLSVSSSGVAVCLLRTLNS
jgi:hypothetical protein